MTLAFRTDDKGILPDRHDRRAGRCRRASIATAPFDPDQIQPASLDLRLGEVAYRVRASFLPGPGTDGRRAHRPT